MGRSMPSGPQEQEVPCRFTEIGPKEDLLNPVEFQNITSVNNPYGST
jgi:hypothetical protein